MNIEVKDTRTANLIKGAINAMIVDLKSSLHTEAGGDSMDMVIITELVTDINALDEVSNQISVKVQFPVEG